MHRSVLDNKGYQKFSLANAVEVICMEEIERAEREKSTHLKTYRAKDGYGDEVDYMVHFPGLTLGDLRSLSNTQTVLRFMDGGKIPYTAIVDPHTGKAMEAIKGKPTVKSLQAAIKRARAKLEEEHGKGVDRKLWLQLVDTEVKVDVALAEEKYGDAVKLYVDLAKKLKRPTAIVKSRLEAMHAAIDEDLVKAKQDKLRKKLG
ncbi:MAG: hypothetical protein AAGD14_15360 [Planctomycetota bacterium]